MNQIPCSGENNEWFLKLFVDLYLLDLFQVTVGDFSKYKMHKKTLWNSTYAIQAKNRKKLEKLSKNRRKMIFYMKIERIEFSNLIWRLTRWPRRMILAGKWSVNIQEISVVLSSFQKIYCGGTTSQNANSSSAEEDGSEIFLYDHLSKIWGC